jgi:hypothetical protein
VYFTEVSAKTGEGVRELFNYIAGAFPATETVGQTEEPKGSIGTKLENSAIEKKETKSCC